VEAGDLGPGGGVHGSHRPDWSDGAVTVTGGGHHDAMAGDQIHLPERLVDEAGRCARASNATPPVEAWNLSAHYERPTW